MSSAVSTYSRKNPFPARLTKTRRLTAPGSGKETLHFEVSLAGSGLAYEVGDSLGVFPSNDPAEVDAALAAAGLSGDETVESAGTSLREVLGRQVTLREPSRQLLAAILAKCPEATELSELIDPEAKSVMDDWIEAGRDTQAGDGEMWLARAAIIHQLRFGDSTDTNRLFGYCLRRADDSDFFIRKAIGWALRQYARTDPEAVRTFVDQHRDELSPLSVREATKHL